MTTEAAIIDRHLTMFQAGDIDGLMADYAPDAVLLIDDQVIAGHPALRAFFDHVFTAMFPGGVRLDLKSRASSHEVTLITWSARTPNLHVTFGTDTLLVRGGQICAHTAAIQANPATEAAQDVGR